MFKPIYNNVMKIDHIYKIYLKYSRYYFYHKNY